MRSDTALYNRFTDVLLAAQPPAITEADLRGQISLYNELIEQRLQKIVVVGHSQGNYFINDAYARLSSRQRRSIGVVAVATPAPVVAGGGPHFTKFLDLIHLFPDALPANTLSEDCGVPWSCHKFADSYMEGLAGVFIGREVIALFDSLAEPLPPQLNTHSISVARSAGQHLSISDTEQTGLDLTGDFTIEAWARASSIIPPGQEYVMVSKWSPFPSDKSYVFLYYHDGIRTTLGLGTSKTATSDDKEVYVSAMLPVGEWHHVAVVFTAATGSAEFFMDGQSIGSESGLGSTVNDGNGSFQIGTRNSLTVTSFDGRMDEVRVWNIARSDQEIVENRLKSLSGNEPGLVGYWSFECDGNDNTGNANNLTPINGATFLPEVPFGEGTVTCN